MVNLINCFFFFTLFSLAILSAASANDGYFVCTPPETLIDHTLGIEYGSLNYTGLGVTDLVHGNTSSQQAYFALNFTQFPYVIEAHHSDSLFQSGQRVFKARELILLKSVIGTHSGATLYRTKDLPGSWSMVHDSGRILADRLLPSDLNRITQGTAYALVGRRVALVGFSKRTSLATSFCVKQGSQNESFSAERIRFAFMQLMKDYNDSIKGQQSVEMSSFAYSDDLHQPLDARSREAMVNMLSDFFQNHDLVFRSQYGNYLSMGAVLASSSLLTLRLMMRRSNVALALLPPESVDSFFMIGKTPIYTPEDSEISFNEIEELFKTNDGASIIEAIEGNPRLEAYLHQLTRVIHQQTMNPNEI